MREDQTLVLEADASRPDATLAAYNRGKAAFLRRLAWSIEITLVATGLVIALAQYLSVGGDQRAVTGIAVAGVFVIVAVAELAKIPAATVAFHARGWWRLLPAAALLVISAISFETVFNGFERFAHATTAVVAAARGDLADLEARKAALSSVALEEATDMGPILEADRQRREDLRAGIAAAERGLAAAEAGGETTETRVLRRQREELGAERDAAVVKAGEDWDREMATLERRLRPDSGIDQRMRDQLNAYMHAMPPRQKVTDGAAARRADSIADLDRRIEASITSTTPEQADAIAAARIALDEARRTLASFDKEAAERLAQAQRQRQERLAAAADRSVLIEELEGEIAAAEAAVAEAAAGSQMHRWGAFVFGRDAKLITEAEAKTVAAFFGGGLAIAAALAGSITAVFAEWFETRGVAPLVLRVPVEIEKRVEVEVEKRVEVPVEIERLIYVPLPTGPGSDEAAEELLAALPPALADELRREIGAGHVARLAPREADGVES
jgi:hypothetical protein